MTTRNIPAALQADLDADVGTFTRLMQVIAKDGTILGLAELDREVVYDAGDTTGLFANLGSTTYLPDPGFDPGEIDGYHDLAIDGGDAMVLVPIDATPISPEDIRAGKWDDALFRVMMVNYEDLSHGHIEICAGYFGNITMRDDVLLVIQLDGLTRPLKQTMCWLDSISCRAVFGSQETEAVEFCSFDVSSLWINFTVTAVDADDSVRSFTASGLAQAAGFFLPGGLLWDTGDNAGNTFWGIDTHDTGGVIGLRQTLPYPIQVGDTGRIRTDCTKQPEGDKGCRSYFGNDWVLHFRGEPNIQSVVNAMNPGARVGPGQGGATTEQSPETAPE